MAGYIRQSSFVDGDTITAALFNDEYNQLVNAFSNTDGHKHDGTTAEGPVIGLIGDAGETSPNNKVLIDTTNNYIEFYIEVSSAPVQQLYIADGAIVPVTDNDIDLGTSSLEFKNLYLDGTAKIDTLTVDEAATIGTTLGVTGATTLSSTLGVTGATTLSSTLAVTGATTLSSTLAVTGTSTLTGNVTTTNNLSVGGNLTVTGNATISGNLTFGDADTDTITIGADVASNITPDVDDTYDLGTSTKEWRNLYIDGTANIDSLVADTADINAGTIDNTVIGGTTAVAGSFTTATATTGNITTVNATTVDTTNIEVTNLKAKDGTSAGSIADSTGVVTLASSVLTTTDINGGTIDNATIATSNITVGTGKTLDVSSGTLTLADNQISGDKVEGGTIAATTITDLTFGSLNDGTITVANFIDDDTFGTASATTLPTSESVKAYVDAQVTAQDLDFQGDSGGALSIDLDSETLTIAGGTGIDTSGAANTLTVSIDSTVATLTGTQTLTNKTLTSPTVNTATISGGTINNAVIGGTTPVAGTFTTLTANTSITGTLATAAQPNITSVGTLSSLTTSGNVTVGGNLTVNGTTTTVNSTTVTIDDPIFTLGGDTAPSVDDNKDRGIEFRWHNGTAAKVGFFGYDDSASVFTFIPDATNTSEVFSGSAGNVAFGNIAGTLATAAQPNITSLGTITGLTTTGDINFGDNDKAVFGAGSDLQIYHTGSVSVIEDSGTGNLLIRGTDMRLQNAAGSNNYLKAVDGAEVELMHGGATKLATTSSGIDVTGVAVVDGLTSSAAITSTSNSNSLGGTTFTSAVSGTSLSLSASITASGNSNSLGGTNFTSNIDVTGTVTADGLTVDGGADGSTSYTRFTEYSSGYGFNGAYASYKGSSNELIFGRHNTFDSLTANDIPVMSFARATGDISFYDDTGVSQALFWDASAESLGIGTTSPATSLHVNSGANGEILRIQGADAQLRINNSTANVMDINSSGSGDSLTLSTNDTERLRIDSSGNVGIGTTSPATQLHVRNTGVSGLTLERNLAGAGASTTLQPIIFGGMDSGSANANHSYAKIDTITSSITNGSESGNLRFFTSGSGTLAERLRIDSSGNVGIGTSSPASALDIHDASAAIIVRDTTSAATGVGGAIKFQGYTSGTGSPNNFGVIKGTKASGNAGGELTFSTSATNGSLIDRMIIDESGNVGIGTSSPSTLLYVQGNSTADVCTVRHGSTTNTNVGQIIFRDGAGDFCGQITSNGSTNTTAYNTSSDARLKNVLGEAKGLEVINQLNPVHFEWKKSGIKQDGLIAQEVDPIVPNVVTHNKESDVYSMDYSKLVTPLIKAVQEQQVLIEQLQAEVALLKGE